MTTLERSRERWKYIIALVVLLLVGTMVAIISYNPTSSETHSQTSSTKSINSSTSSQSSYPDGQAYLNVPKVYSDLGYPKIRYTDYSPYLSSKPNYTMEYQTKNVSFQVGSVGGDVISLDQAVGLAAEKVGLNPSNYSLAYAAFYPGTIVNGTLTIHPIWYLFFARAYDSFWLFGSYGNGAFSVEVDVDVFNGTIRGTNIGLDLSNLPNSGSYQLEVNSSRALETVRASSVTGVPSTLTENGTASSVEPRIVLLGPSSNNEAFQNPLNASLSGEKRLCWIIQLYSPTPQYGYQGTFAVDAETGELVSGWAQALYPSMHIEYVNGVPDFSSGKQLAVSQETFQMNGSVVGRSGSVPVDVPNVVIVRPSSTASIDLNFSSTLTKDVNATMSFSNPLPGFQTLSSNGLPDGVSIQFSRGTFIVPGNGSRATTLLISVDGSAPSGTYLIRVNATLFNPQWAGEDEVMFFLSVWDGTGQWPPPPIIK